ncbi:hypothetical protein [Clostridium saccharoperbutylacetonicum]|uniref:hypothetical protein n=1 Tax=Clostridium saccharoperbutylacetonicum TaxID=36745 RepID=UPI0039EC2FA1
MYEYKFKIKKTNNLCGRGIIGKEKGFIQAANYEEAKQKLDERIDLMQERNTKLEILEMGINEVREKNGVYITDIKNENIGKWN